MKKKASIIILVFSMFFVFSFPPMIEVNAATDKDTISSYKTYLRSGRFAGGFTMVMTASHDYSSWSTLTWRFTKFYNLTTVSDKTLPIRLNDANVSVSQNGSVDQTHLLTNCASHIGDANVQNFCEDKSGVWGVPKGGTTISHTSNIVLDSLMYSPSIHTNRINFTGY